MASSQVTEDSPVPVELVYNLHSGWVPELVALGYDRSLPTPINVASQTALAAITSRSVHNLIQQLDHAAVEVNSDNNDTLSQQGQAALLLDTLGISHWIALQFAFSKNGEEAALALVRQYHDELPQILEVDLIEDSRSEKLAADISVALSWDSLERKIPVDESNSVADVPTQVKNNPLISFDHFTEEEKSAYTNQLDNFSMTQASDLAANFDAGDPFVPVDTPRTVEYRVSEKSGMMWRISNMNNLSPISLDMWVKFANVSDAELKRCEQDAKQGSMVAKIHTLRDSIKMSSFRDKYKCPEVATVRIKMNLATDSSRVPKHKVLMWNWLRPYLRCGYKNSFGKQGCIGEVCWFDHAVWYILNHLEDFFPHGSLTARYMAFLIFLGSDARNAVLAQCTFIFARRLMIEAAVEFFVDPTAQLLPQHGDLPGVRTIERLIKPACFSDGIITERIQGSKKRPKTTQNLNLNTAPTRIVPMGRGQRMRGGRSNFGYRQQNTPNSYNSRSSSSHSSGLQSVNSHNRGGYRGKGSPLPRRNMSREFN
ncbi:hypothetical protein R1sor_008986 [Riccia sorocarpa]|uniref:Uncharacterized protein n=1 Tax=Riccia sorocarpa TaxID=122646 RepID=A0ABD3H7B5_9MARC